jgi:hypothetical protein
MTNQDRAFPNYYDGSSHLDIAEELADGLGSLRDEEPGAPEEWRRYIGVNPSDCAKINSAYKKMQVSPLFGLTYNGMVCRQSNQSSAIMAKIYINNENETNTST